MFASPRLGYGPGYVFRISNDDPETQQWVVTLNSDQVDTTAIILPGFHQSWDSNLLIRFLGLSKVMGTADGNNQVNFDMAFGKSARQALSDNQLDSLVRAMKINFKENNRYFVITTTIATDSLGYKFDSKDGFSTKAASAVDKIKDTAKVSVLTKSGSNFAQKFERKYRIFYKICEITASGTKFWGNAKLELINVKDIVIKQSKNSVISSC